jgi:hypothetical protein
MHYLQQAYVVAPPVGAVCSSTILRFSVMQRPQLTPTSRNLAIAVTAGLVIGMSAFVASRPADAVDQVPAQTATDSERAAESTFADSVALKAAADSADAQARREQAAADSAAKAAQAASGDPSQTQPASGRYRAGEDPAFAEAMGWPVDGPAPLPGAILPSKRIVAYYGNPLSKRMGALGEYAKDDMLSRLEDQIADWRSADPGTPVLPALHLIAVVAQGDSGVTGKYRSIVRDTEMQMRST